MKRDPSSSLMSAIRTIVNGTEPVSIATLRERLDTALLDLAHSGEVVLHRHPHPERLPAGELLLFDPEADAFYTAISLPQEENLEAFAAIVRRAAHASPTGRWHDNKVFISHVWNEFRRQGAAAMSFEDFQRRLIEANRAQLIELSRADLVQAMPPDDVAASETPHLNATFHFIRLDDGQNRRRDGVYLPTSDKEFAKRVINPKTFRDFKAGDYGAYAEEAHRLTVDACKLANEAQNSLSRRALRAARTAVDDAVAMHQRATLAAGAAENETLLKSHRAAWEDLLELRRGLLRLTPKVP